MCVRYESKKQKLPQFYAGHIGSNDAELSTNHLSAIQNQMQSKGGYDMNSLRVQVNITIESALKTNSIRRFLFLCFSIQAC